jgi:hypothetical protein
MVPGSERVVTTAEAVESGEPDTKSMPVRVINTTMDVVEEGVGLVTGLAVGIVDTVASTLIGATKLVTKLFRF